jgi:hypothetical protein
MENFENSFIISGSKDLIFRREFEKTYVYDPYDLVTYQLNDTATEILYLIYLKYDIDMMINHFKSKYNAEDSIIRQTINDFIRNSPFLRSIMSEIIELRLLEK